ncbi:MAG TPA: MBL fold metallo-hydrolase [Gemmatimonadales bacterium]|nr:MBL fold metallo-hydrolase [Gemmatimonadales bacterium]
MKIVQIPNGQFVENSYLVIDEGRGECAIVDPGEEAGLIVHKLTAAGARPAAIWITHAHLDHVLGVARLKRETGVPVYLHPADRELYDHVVQQGLAFGMPTQALPPPDRDFVPGEEVRVGDLTFTVRHTPGHSPGSVCLVGDGVVFTGDVLFAGSIGRTDLPGGDFETLIKSIERELLPLPDSTIVYSGHGPETTIGRERLGNPFLTGVYRFS